MTFNFLRPPLPKERPVAEKAPGARMLVSGAKLLRKLLMEVLLLPSERDKLPPAKRLPPRLGVA